MVRHHADHVFLSIRIMEQRRVKSHIVQRHRLRPRSHDILRRNQIISRIIHIAVKRIHHRIRQIENALIIRKTGGPDSLRRSDSLQIYQSGVLQRIGTDFPVDKIPGMVDLYPRPPFKGRGGNIIIHPDPYN